MFLLFETTSLGLVGNGSTDLTWAQKNYVNGEWLGTSVTVRNGQVKLIFVCVCASATWRIGPQCEMSTLHASVKSKSKPVTQRYEALGAGRKILSIHKQSIHLKTTRKPFLPCPAATLPLVVGTTCSSEQNKYKMNNNNNNNNIKRKGKRENEGVQNAEQSKKSCSPFWPQQMAVWLH